MRRSPRPLKLLVGTGSEAWSCPKCKLRSSLAALQQLRRPNIAAAAASSSSSLLLRVLAKRRYATTSTSTLALASATAINGPRNTPVALQALHRALVRVADDAANYVNISRLQLALLGLESTTPRIRVAIFGLQNQQSARRLARLLVADPTPEEAAWEKQLYSLDFKDDRTIILQYGQGSGSPSRESLNSTHYVPSEFLRKNNLEVLISSMNLRSSDPQSAHDVENFKTALLVPTAEIPKPFGGAVSYIRYPVHRAIIVADDILGCFSLGKYSSGASSSPLMYTVNLSQSSESDNTKERTVRLTTIDLNKAGQAFSKLRRTAWNETTFQDAWKQTGMPRITSWLGETSETDSAAIRPAVEELIMDLLQETSRNIETEEAMLQRNSTPKPRLDQVREELDEALNAWATRAHTELRDELDAAFLGKSWSTIKWWKLPWRVDDIAMVVEELLDRRWLPEAEKYLIWLSGRCGAAGFVISSTALDEKPALDISEGVQNTLSRINDIRELPGQQIEQTRKYPWSTMLHNARISLKKTMVPSLQAQAQALLLQTFTIISMTSALSGLVYLAFPAATVYNSAAIAALGLAWSLRRAQGIWERERVRFENEVKERGRVVLRETEQDMRATILGGSAGNAADLIEGLQSNRAAMRAVELAQTELVQLQHK